MAEKHHPNPQQPSFEAVTKKTGTKEKNKGHFSMTHELNATCQNSEALQNKR
jgi:hypothetical protein